MTRMLPQIATGKIENLLARGILAEPRCRKHIVFPLKRQCCPSTKNVTERALNLSRKVWIFW